MNKALFNVQERILSKDRNYILVKNTYQDCTAAYNDALIEKNKWSRKLVALNKKVYPFYYLFKHASIISIFLSIILCAFTITNKLPFIFLLIELILCFIFSIIYFFIGNYILHNKTKSKYLEWSDLTSDLYDAQFAAWQNLRIWDIKKNKN